ncbi:hypothetical protein MZJ39_001805 [Vibrio parahaemolyticus]|nr:hypothetical protein [Vibrio parahaemolyticus]EGR3036285.1 hypothetical protein [Vibrio parahaemolyticus]EIE1185779.1 hypothetical protein [Vibrio parahaemolyticus]EJC6996167.1 hypothetical protein [Vibrio parahaemolyticus]EJC6999169.1 hypothetical protein [Vibrio parahaemolyticus]
MDKIKSLVFMVVLGFSVQLRAQSDVFIQSARKYTKQVEMYVSDPWVSMAAKCAGAEALLPESYGYYDLLITKIEDKRKELGFNDVSAQLALFYSIGFGDGVIGGLANVSGEKRSGYALKVLGSKMCQGIK